MQLASFYKFYPGSTWVKRLTHLLVISGIGLNAYLNEIQDVLLQKSEEILTDAQVLTQPVATEAENVKQNVVPILRWLEQSQWGRAIEFDIRIFFGVNITIPRAYVVEETMNKVQEFDRKITRYSPILEISAKIIRWTNILIWFSVLFVSLPWLLVDLFLGESEERRFTFYGLLLASIAIIGVYRLMWTLTFDYIISLPLQ